jgi:hypothetical protein
MKSNFLQVTLLGAAMFFSFHSQAAKYSGYEKANGSDALSFEEPIERYIETKTNFLVLFEHHPAFYLFPKNTQYTGDVREFLNKRIKNQSKISVHFDPRTIKIYSIEDLKK